MHITKTSEYPKEIEKQYQKAIKYEYISIIYLISAMIFLYFTMGQSQSMKTVWVDNILSLIPPISFLITSRLIRKPANKLFPYGFHRTTSIAFLTSSLTLFAVGLFLLYDGTSTLINLDHPTISIFFIGNHAIWMGYLMILALLWQAIPTTILGHLKFGLSKSIYDKILFTDAKMNKADWMAGFGSIIGIIGIGFGLWWTDSFIAILISISITHDGYKNLKQSILDLIDETPKKLGSEKIDPLIYKVNKILKEKDWIKNAEIRFRVEGHVFFGEVIVIPKSHSNLINNIENLKKQIENIHWRMHDIVIMPISKIED